MSQESIAVLAQRYADDAQHLARCLAEFEDDPTCCGEWLDAVDTTRMALDRALGLPQDRLPEDIRQALDTAHSRLTMIYVMLTQGRGALVDLGVFKATLDEIEGVYADVVPV